MRRSLARIALAFMLLAVSVPLGGCKWSPVKIAIPGFGGGSVDGLWFWRYSSTTGAFERACRIDLSNAQSASETEIVTYNQVCPDQGTMDMWARIERHPTDASMIVLELWYVRWEEAPGLYRVSSFNTAGESALSATEVTL